MNVTFDNIRQRVNDASLIFDEWDGFTEESSHVEISNKGSHEQFIYIYIYININIMNHHCPRLTLIRGSITGVTGSSSIRMGCVKHVRYRPCQSYSTISTTSSGRIRSTPALLPCHGRMIGTITMTDTKYSSQCSKNDTTYYRNMSNASSSFDDDRRHPKPHHSVCTPPAGSKNQNDHDDDIHSSTTTVSINPEEIQKFSKMSHQWWDTKYNPLISMNPIRMQFIQQCIQQYYCCTPETNDDENVTVPSNHHHPESPSRHRDVSTLNILDIGCGGGLLCESFVRLGIGNKVIGLDPSTSLIEMAQYHYTSTTTTTTTTSPPSPTKLQYYNTTVQDFYHNISIRNDKNSVVMSSASTISSATSTSDATTEPTSQNQEQQKINDNDNKFDIICCLEVLEHVSNDQRHDMLQVACQHLLRDNGLLFISTINPTFQSYMVTIFGAEYIARILPVGTHHWNQYISHTTIRDDLSSLSSAHMATVGNRDTKEQPDHSQTSPPTAAAVAIEPPMRMMERSVAGMVIPLTSLPAAILFHQWDWRLDPDDTNVNWIGCYQKVNTAA